MSYLTIFLQLIPFLNQIMRLVEKAFDDKPESGAEKKVMAKEGAHAVVDAMLEVSTGGQEETWNILEPVVDTFIDLFVGAFNLLGIFKK